MKANRFGSVRCAGARVWLLAFLCVPLVPAAAAAQLYMPRTVKQAFANGTRSPDGRPGPNYWENHGRYDITITATPPDRTVRGTEQITYVNNSPDTLNALVFKLFLNIHEPGAPRAGGASPEYLNPGISIDSFAVNGQPTEWQDSPRFFTWQPVRLPTPLLPHDSVKLAFHWHYPISLQDSREGRIDPTTYYLAYFYPRVAVYDDYNGWDMMNFNGRQEFYSDFNDYDVTVRVPANFVVWGTGTLTNPEQVLQPGALQRYQSSFTSDDVVHVATGDQIAAGQITRQGPMNEWHFRSRYVSDVAFAVSNHYDWDAGSVLVDDATNRRASVQSAYNDTAADYHYMVEFGQRALGWFSHNLPGVPYPYEKSTIVQGHADMEYPMMVNDGSTPDTAFSRFVAEHEIAHTYMPFYMGINETRYGFMDEGWATTFEYFINQANMGEAWADSVYRNFRVAAWINDPSPLEDLPIITPEDVLGASVAYGHNAYGKASLGYLAVKDLLGDATFKKALLTYMDRWHGKHPIPWDFFNTFNDASGQNLDWFWRNWYFSNNYIDMAVESVARASGGYAVTIRNVGGMDAPVDLVLHFSDGSAETLHETPSIWKAGTGKATVSVATNKQLQSLQLDGGIFMDANPADNGWTAR